jgi:hypothetical protein
LCPLSLIISGFISVVVATGSPRLASDRFSGNHDAIIRKLAVFGTGPRLVTWALGDAVQCVGIIDQEFIGYTFRKPRTGP